MTAPITWLAHRWRTIAFLAFCALLGLNIAQDRQQGSDLARQGADLEEAVAQLEEIVAEQAQDSIDGCERGNQLRRSIRDLARDLNANPDDLAAVDSRFAHVDCRAVTTRPPGGNP